MHVQTLSVNMAHDTMNLLNLKIGFFFLSEALISAFNKNVPSMFLSLAFVWIR